MTPVIASPEVNPDLINLPSGDIYSNEPPVESSIHLNQIFLLLSCLELFWHDRHDYFAAGNLTIYYQPAQNQNIEFRGPDFFVVLGTEKKDRKSWVVYREGGRYPHVIVEILSDSTAGVDRTIKKEIYQDIFRTPDYFWFHPETLEFQGFHLVEGKYVELIPNDRGHLWSQQLGLYLGIHDRQLRYFAETGELVPTPNEARIREHDRAERLAAKLRELNIDPEQI
ncbi:MAG: Uma2 family endonuclease [Coleofasciculaceae cyanobacterium SM2_1_6]|nr:Uma2 family endonuclease [Coleofasciculaceae cyanobacterium SM2_1_6]